jgi:hypothetical protein
VERGQRLGDGLLGRGGDGARHPPRVDPLGARNRVGAGEQSQLDVGDGAAFGEQELGELLARCALAPREAFGCRGAWPARRRRIEHDAPGHRLAPAGLAQDEPVVHVEDERRGEPDPGERAFGRHRRRSVEVQRRVALRRTRVESEGSSRGQRVRQAAHGMDPPLEHIGRPPLTRPAEDVAAFEPGALHTREVRRDPRDRPRELDPALVRLERADSRPHPGRENLDLVADRQASARQRSGHDGSGTGDREDAIDVLPRPAIRRRFRRGRHHRIELGDELVQPFAGRGRARDDRCVGERGAAGPFADLFPNVGQAVVVDEISLGEGDDASVHAEHVDDREVLLGLASPPFVRGDHEEHESGRPDSGEHRPHEALVARDVDEPDLAPRG